MNYVSEIAKILALAEEAGFQKGWQAARDALSAPMPKAKVAGNATQTPVKKKAKKAKRPKPSFGTQVATTVETQVKGCIDAHPGKTGAQIIGLLDTVNPRTVRTMLRRLKLKGEIEKSGEGWFTKLE